MSHVDRYDFYYEGGAHITARWTTEAKALQYAAELADETGHAIEVSRGVEHDYVATYDPDE